MPSNSMSFQRPSGVRNLRRIYVQFVRCRCITQRITRHQTKVCRVCMVCLATACLK